MHAAELHSRETRGFWPYWLIMLACVLAGAAAHLAYLLSDCPLDLSGDEAHYWEWSRRLDLSYYSKGPLVAYIIAAGRWLLAESSERWIGNEMLAVRGPALLLSIATSLGIFALAARTTRCARCALGAVLLTFTIPILVAGSMLMTIDAPLATAWVWALYFSDRAVRSDRLADWLMLGLLCALGFLAKYTMALIFPAVGLLILLLPTLRRLAARPGPYLATLIGLAGLTPIVIWNAQHDWVSLRHVAGQAGLPGSAARSGVNPLGPVTLIAGQLAVVGIIWFPLMVTAAFAVWRRDASPKPRAPREVSDPPEQRAAHQQISMRLLSSAALTPWVVFLIFSPITKIQPNWPVLSLFPGVILLADWIARNWTAPDARLRRFVRAATVCGATLGLAAGLLLHRTDVLMPLFVRLASDAPPWDLTPTAKYDPTARLRGWRQLGTDVGGVLAAERAEGRDPFIVTDDYQTASQIAFYTPGEPRVYCLQSALGDRKNQYDIWENPVRDLPQFVGRACIYVGALHAILTGADGTPAALSALTLRHTSEHRVRGELVALWTIYTSDEFCGLQIPIELHTKY